MATVGGVNVFSFFYQRCGFCFSFLLMFLFIYKVLLFIFPYIYRKVFAEDSHLSSVDVHNGINQFANKFVGKYRMLFCRPVPSHGSSAADYKFRQMFPEIIRFSHLLGVNVRGSDFSY